MRKLKIHEELEVGKKYFHAGLQKYGIFTDACKRLSIGYTVSSYFLDFSDGMDTDIREVSTLCIQVE